MNENTQKQSPKSPKKSAKSLQFYMRAVHRVLGYLTLGMVVVYALSGVIFIHRTSGFLQTEKQIEQTLAPNLDGNALGKELKLKPFNVLAETETAVKFNGGEYDKTTGRAAYTKRELAFPFNKFSNLHKVPFGRNPVVCVLTTLFGISLFLLALTSLFMFKPGTKPFKQNMIYAAIGVVLVVVLLAFA